MKRATITELKNGLSALIDVVKAGESILILDRGIPVARLEPALSRHAGDDEGRLVRLERAGVITRGTGEYPKLVDEPPPRAQKSVLDALLEERREGR